MNSDESQTITELVDQIRSGSAEAKTRLVEKIYDEMQRLASGLMRREAPNQTLQTTALVHEAYLRLDQAGLLDDPKNRSYLFSSIERAMRQALADHGRRRKAIKRGGGFRPSPLDAALETFQKDHGIELLAFEEALLWLDEINGLYSQVILLRSLCGLSHQEIANSLGVSVSTVQKHWKAAKALLWRRLKE